MMFILLIAAPAYADEFVSIADFSAPGNGRVPEGWQLKEKSGKADVTPVQDGEIHAVRLRSGNSSFSLQKKVRVNLKQYPVLTWEWKVTRLPDGGDFRKSATDDQAAQLFIAFSKTRAIVYLWDTSAPQGIAGDAAAPFFMSIKAVVVRSGRAETGKWLTETRNVYEDYKMLFREEPGEVSGVRLQINSQHTGSSAESYFANVAFLRQ